jgi:hypothetical protein
MQLNSQGIAIISQMRYEIEQLKTAVGIKQFVRPSIDIFHTSLTPNIREQLRQKIVPVGDQVTSYPDALKNYDQTQAHSLCECIDSILKLLQTLIIDKNITDIYFNKLIDFIEYEQLQTIAPDVALTVLDKINPAMKLRMVYYLIDTIYTGLSSFRKGESITITHSSDQNILKKIDKLTADFEQNLEKRQHLYVLFYSELHIREASILATGELPRMDQLSDIFIVYKTASYGLGNLRQQDSTLSYYNLALKTLSQLSKASSAIQTHNSDQQLSVIVQPVNDETAVGHHGLVRRSVFGVKISYQDTQGAILDVNASPGFNHVYRIKPHYRLEPQLKIAYLSHIKVLVTRLNNSPKHAHAKRREEKLEALEYIVESDNQGDLSPATFDQAKNNKPYLFVAWRQSKTQQLIECAEEDLKVKMWEKFSKEKQSIGQIGYSITDEDLVLKLSDKYLSYTSGQTYDVNKKISDLIEPDTLRQGKSGYALWNYDKKMALEIILIAHYQQLLHPALLKAIEENYPSLYARSLWFMKESKVEQLFLEVKNNILFLLWNDSSNDPSYGSPKNAGGLSCLK